MLKRDGISLLLLPLVIVVALLSAFAPTRVVAQSFSVFNSPAGRSYLVSHTAKTVTDFGGKWVDGPLVVDRGGVPHIFNIGNDLGVWYTTDRKNWSNLGGGACTRFRRVWLEAGIPAVQAVCGGAVHENKTLTKWAFTQAPNPRGEPTSVLQPIFVGERYAVFRKEDRSTSVVDLQDLVVLNLGGDLINEPIAELMGSELALFGVSANGSVMYRTLSTPWRDLGGKAERISSVTITPDGGDAVIVIPGEQFGKARRRTLGSDWREVDPLAVLPAVFEQSSAQPVAPLEPATSVDEFLDSFIDAWGSDIIVLRSLKSVADFEAKLPSLKTSTLETKLIQAFDKTPLKEVAAKLVVAFPRSKYSEGAAKATVDYLKALSAKQNEVVSSFTAVLRNLPDDVLSDQRSVVLDLFSRIPGITPTYRGFLLSTLTDKTLGLQPDILSPVARKYYVVMLGHALLATQPTERDARAGVAAAISFSLDEDQKKDLETSLDNYLRFQDAYLVCDATSCRNRPTKGQSCSESAPCSLGLQCFGGSCVEFSEKGAGCGYGKPLCHPALTCQGEPSSPNRVCVERAKLMESCKDRACQFGLSCLQKLGVCVDTAKEGESCSGLGKPCVDGRTLTCVEGICAKRGRQGEKCSSGRRCVEDLRCSDPNGGTCGPRLEAGRRCDPLADECGVGLACRINTAIALVHMCTKTGEIGALCGPRSPATLCDPEQGLICGSKYECRKPGVAGDLANNRCGEDWDCASGLQCIHGTCQTKQNAGGPCQKAHHCVDGLLCATTGPNTTTCVAPGRDGFVCSSDEQCDVRNGYGCGDLKVGVLTPRTCIKLQGQGSFCGGNLGRCAAGLTCSVGFGGMNGTCVALGTWEGAQCPCLEPWFSCSSWGGFNQCVACANDQETCWAPGRVQRKACPGVHCQRINDFLNKATSECVYDDGVTCNGSRDHICVQGQRDTVRRCHLRRKFNESCAGNNLYAWTPCAEGLYCHGFTQWQSSGQYPPLYIPDGKCMPRIPRGGACDSAQPCVEGATCVRNVCT